MTADPTSCSPSSQWLPIGTELSAADWNRILLRINVPSLLTAIDERIGPRLRTACELDDVWQETLRRAWAGRSGSTWRGVTAFRQWLLLTAERVIRDLVDTQGAQKRGGGRACEPLVQRDPASETNSNESYAGPVVSTTPSRVASDRERAAVLRRALDDLPDDLRLVVRLRVLDALQVEDVADRTGLGVSAVRHRVRKGLEILARRLRGDLGESGR